MASTPVVVINAYGDDGLMGLQESNGWYTTLTSTEPDQSTTLLQTEFSDSGISVVDLASGGTASSLPNLLAGDDGSGPPLATRLSGSNAKFVIEEHGMNEAYEGVDAYNAALSQWLQTVRNAGMTPILEEPSPSCDPNEINLPQYVAAMDAFAAANNVTLISQYAAIEALPDWTSHLGDCRYPDAYLTAFRAQREAAALAPLVKTALGE